MLCVTQHIGWDMQEPMEEHQNESIALTMTYERYLRKIRSYMSHFRGKN